MLKSGLDCLFFKTSPMGLILTLMMVTTNGNNMVLVWDTGETVLVKELKEARLKN